MLYTMLGRVIVRIFRGYFRYAFPNARRNIAIAGITGVAVLAGISAARRRAATGANQRV